MWQRLSIFSNSPIIQTIEGLENLADLEELWLGKNKITRLEVCFFLLQKSGPQTDDSVHFLIQGPAKSQKAEDSFHSIEQDNKTRGIRRARRARSTLSQSQRCPEDRRAGEKC